ncbi:MAG: hypothetical protein IJC88_02265 [Oscillospiraceae bacterium]|nr:hypothetical protein [Oscillospiraceae bacterium]
MSAPESPTNALLRSRCFLTWEMTAEGLALTHTSGDAILYGTNGATFTFPSTEE